MGLLPIEVCIISGEDAGGHLPFGSDNLKVCVKALRLTSHQCGRVRRAAGVETAQRQVSQAPAIFTVLQMTFVQPGYLSESQTPQDPSCGGLGFPYANPQKVLHEPARRSGGPRSGGAQLPTTPRPDWSLGSC